MADMSPDPKRMQNMALDDAFAHLASSPNGLTTAEVQTRMQQYGLNEFAKEHNLVLRIFLKQFRSSLIYLLILAAILSFFLDNITDGFVITSILSINAFLGFFQEYRSARAIEHLTKLINRTAVVMRDGQQISIEEKFLVPGDIVKVKRGDIVAADMKIIEAEDILVDESQLTGESLPKDKSATPSGKEETNTLLFAGSTVERGGATCIVYATAETTKLGRIAALSRETRKDTEYERSLEQLSTFLVRTTVAILFVVFCVKLLVSGDIAHIASLFFFIVAMAIAVVPEAMPVIASVTLSRGALRLAKKHVVVKRLSSVEDLGNITLLCTDKTGTLTENKLSVIDSISDDPIFFQKIAAASTENPEGKQKTNSNAYDAALSQYIPKEVQREARSFHQIRTYPFEPERRRRSVILEDINTHKYYLVSLGAPSSILPLTKNQKRNQLLAQVAVEGKSGIRHFAIACTEVTLQKDFDLHKHEKSMHLLGIVRLTDPLRPTATRTIELAKKLGVSVKILSGDTKEVSEYIGKEVGLLSRDELAYTGNELDAMSEKDYMRSVFTCNVFAEVTPEQKYKIIQTLKEQFVVGYQGDGINDAPSLKLADVSIAVDTATDVAKDNADIVLLRRELSVIIGGIQYGRTIFVNMNKYVKHTMVSNWGNLFALAVLFIFSKNLPLLAIQVLLTSLITDIPLITIYSDNVDLEEISRPQKYNIRSIMFVSLFLGTITMLFELMFYAIVRKQPLTLLQTEMYLFLTITALMVVFSIRTRKPFYRTKPPSLLMSVIVILAVVGSLLFPYIPQLATIFSFIPLPMFALFIVIGMSLVYFFTLDVTKTWYYRLNPHD